MGSHQPIALKEHLTSWMQDPGHVLSQSLNLQHTFLIERDEMMRDSCGQDEPVVS